MFQRSFFAGNAAINLQQRDSMLLMTITTEAGAESIWIDYEHVLSACTSDFDAKFGNREGGTVRFVSTRVIESKNAREWSLTSEVVSIVLMVPTITLLTLQIWVRAIK